MVTPPTDYTLELPEVRDKHLRVTNGTIEDVYIERLIRVSEAMAERTTRRAHLPQTRALVMDRFPWWKIEVPRPPLIEVESIKYYDADGVLQTLSESSYQVDAPPGPTAPYGEIIPAVGEAWPTTQFGRIDAVTVRFRCGYVDGSSPENINIPEPILQGQLLVIGELYKHRALSVHGPGLVQNPTIISAKEMWKEYKVGM